MSPSELLNKRILRKAGRAVHRYSMITEGDRVLVALSGGKDSWTLLHVLQTLKRRAPVHFDVAAVTIHPGFPGFQPDPVAQYCRAQGWEHWVEPTRIYDIVEDKRDPSSSYCSFCARLRRGVLYGLARRQGFSKIALGHHADDLIETLLLGQFFTGEIKSMPPVLHADDGCNVVIRPLCTVFEADILAFAAQMAYPVICCGCPMCSSGDMKRRRVKALLNQLEAEHRGIKASMLASLGRVRPQYLTPPPAPARRD